METPEPEGAGSRLQTRAVDLAVWALVILVIVGIAAGAAWYLSNVRFELREVPPPFEDAQDVELLEDDPEFEAPTPPTPGGPSALDGAGTSNPLWLTVPTPRFPLRAARSGQAEGAVRLTCVAEVTGRVSRCQIVSEAPAGFGFGVNAVRAAERARVQPQMIDGVPVASSISFNVRYRPAPDG